MIFNKSGRQLKESYQFKYGATTIPSTKSYTHIGVVFTLFGSQQRTQQILRQKALRAYFGMKKYVNTKNVPKSATLKLFDSLIVPVATYCSQVWFPKTKICKTIFERNYTHTRMANSTSDPIEKLHMGMAKGTSNAAVYGDTGRIPLVLSILKQSVIFFNCLSLLDRTTLIALPDIHLRSKNNSSSHGTQRYNLG